MTFQMPPPLKFSGVVLMSVQISASLSFHVARALLRLSAIHEPVPVQHHLPVRTVREGAPAPSVYRHTPQPVMRSRICFVNTIMIPPAMVRMPLDRWEGSWDWKDRPT